MSSRARFRAASEAGRKGRLHLRRNRSANCIAAIGGSLKPVHCHPLKNGWSAIEERRHRAVFSPHLFLSRPSCTSNTQEHA